jgi:hypothetical protein
VGDLEAGILIIIGVAAFGWFAFRSFGSGAPHPENSATADINAAGGSPGSEAIDDLKLRQGARRD